MPNDVSELLAQFERQLTREVHRLVSGANLGGIAYCAALNYGDDPCRGVLPVVGVGVLRPGQSVELPSAKLAPGEEHPWNPAEFPTLGDPALQPRSESLTRLDRELAAACIEGAEIDVRASCNRVAIQLNALNWSPLPISRAFVVYAVDDDLVDLDENLALAIAARAGASR